MSLEGTIVAGRVELDARPDWPEGTRVRVEPAAAESSGTPTERRFRELARKWKAATEFTSSLTDMATHPAYQQIIGLGRDSLPLIFEELRREPDWWFWALKAITGEDPVAQGDRGNLPKMTEAWLRWAEAHGYLPCR